MADGEVTGFVPLVATLTLGGPSYVVGFGRATFRWNALGTVLRVTKLPSRVAPNNASAVVGFAAPVADAADVLAALAVVEQPVLAPTLVR